MAYIVSRLTTVHRLYNEIVITNSPLESVFSLSMHNVHKSILQVNYHNTMYTNLHLRATERRRWK